MKPLNEVIKIYERGISEVEAYDAVDDALHYLKEYKNTDENYKKAIAHVTEVIDHYEKMVADYLSVNNPALTWDELKQMEGKPVWIEGTHHKHWCIVKGISRKDLSEMEYITLAYLNNKNRIVTYDRRKGNFDVTWQAYRKERDENA